MGIVICISYMKAWTKTVAAVTHVRKHILVMEPGSCLMFEVYVDSFENVQFHDDIMFNEHGTICINNVDAIEPFKKWNKECHEITKHVAKGDRIVAVNGKSGAPDELW